MYLLITDAYPSSGNLYANMFIHQRVLGYGKAGLSTEVFVCPGPEAAGSRYEYEGVAVTAGGAEALRERLSRRDYDKILIHFISDAMMRALTDAGADAPMIVWVHGHEAMSWFRRWFFFQPGQLFGRKAGAGAGQAGPARRRGLKYYVGKLFGQVGHLRRLRRFILANTARMEFVFVSEWMRSIVEADLRLRFPTAHIIHNPVDTEKFAFVPKTEDQRLKFLTVRPFKNRKYANDITVKAIRLLASKPYFSTLRFLVVGDGPLFDKLTAPLKAYENVTLVKKFLTQAEIASLHRQYGVFLCPTRQDAQGVSMCEAMSSGLVCVSSENTAIPEFLPDGAGFRTRGARGIAAAAGALVEDPAKFLAMSGRAAAFIRGKCGLEDVSRREIELISK